MSCRNDDVGRRMGAHVVEHRIAPLGRHEIELGHDDRARAVELALRHRADQRVGQRVAPRERVGDDEHRRQPERTVQQSDLCDLRGIRHAARFDEQQVGLHVARRDARQRIDERAADRAADAAVVEFDHVVAAGSHETRVDVHRTEIVDEHRDAPAVRRLQDRVDDRRLARAEITADHREVDRRTCSHPGCIGVRIHRGDRNTRPPSTVPHTASSLRRAGAHTDGSSSSTAKSANLPTSMLPTR